VNVVAGLHVPQSGRVVINGRIVLDTKAHISVPIASAVGMSFRTRGCSHMNVERNLLFGWRRRPQQANRTQISQVVGMLALAP